MTVQLPTAVTFATVQVLCDLCGASTPYGLTAALPHLAHAQRSRFCPHCVETITKVMAHPEYKPGPLTKASQHVRSLLQWAYSSKEA